MEETSETARALVASDAEFEVWALPRKLSGLDFGFWSLKFLKRMTSQTKSVIFGLLGAAGAGATGYLAFFWMLGQGFYSPVLPGAFLGLGAGLCTRHRSHWLAGVCGLAAVGLGLFTQWRYVGMGSFGDFVIHVFSEPAVTLIMIALGGFFGYRFALGWGRKPTVAPVKSDPTPPGSA